MTWIKRNLFFVIGVAIGLALTGYCGYLLYGSMSANSGVTDDYNSTRDQLTAMEGKTPYPSTENIDAAKADQERVRSFLADFRTRFAAFPKPPAVDQKGFKTYLEDTLVRFRAEATNAGVEMPENYGFTFAGLMGRLTYPPENIRPWMEQMEEISTILNILYQAKVNYLSSLCRVPVSADDAGTTDCMLPTTSVTNTWGIVTPYKITFRGFSTEIAAVLEGFARSSNCFIVKAVEVVSDRSAMPTPTQPTAQAMAPQVYYMPAPQLNPGMPGRYRDRGMPAPRPTPTPYYQVAAPGATGTAASSAPVTILSETPLLVTMSIDVVKLNAAEH